MPRLPHVRAISSVFLFLVAAAAIRAQAKHVKWAELVRSLSSYGTRRITAGLLLTAASFCLLAATELFALRQIREPAGRAVSKLRGATTGFIAAAFGQSIGWSLLTGGSVRLRSYTARSMDYSDIARVSVFVTATATLGLLATSAVSLMIGPVSISVGNYSFALRWLGLALALITFGYLLWCRHAGERTSGLNASRPTLRVAVGQIAISSLDWIFVASALFILLPRGISSYGHFLPAFFVAQAIAVISHVPGGLGVFEAVLVTLLGQQTINAASPEAAAALAAAFLLYRIIYYLAPLIVAACVAAFSELKPATSAA